MSNFFIPNRPAIKKSTLPENISPGLIKLKNGTEIYTINEGSQPVVKVDIIINRGNPGQLTPLIPLLTATMLTEGTKTKSGQEIAFMLDYYGSYINSTADRDYINITLLSLSKYIDKTLPVLLDIALNPVFPEEEFKIQLARIEQRFKINSEKVSTLAKDNFLSALYGKNHRYGRRIKNEDFNKISTTQLAGYHINQFNPGQFKILVSGSFDETKLINILRNEIDTAETAKSNPHLKEYREEPSSDKKQFIYKQSAIQSALRIGKKLFNRHHPEYPGMLVLNNILGGHFGSRLMQNIREKKGYTYGIGSFLVGMKKSGYFTISTELDNSNCEDALKQIYIETDKLMTKQVTKRELDLTRSQMAGELLRAFDGPFSRAESIKTAIEQEVSTTFYHELADTINNIGPAELKSLAEKHLNSETFYQIVAGAS